MDKLSSPCLHLTKTPIWIKQHWPDRRLEGFVDCRNYRTHKFYFFKALESSREMTT